MSRIPLQGEEFISVTRDGSDVLLKFVQQTTKSEDGRDQLVVSKMELSKQQAIELVEALQSELREY